MLFPREGLLSQFGQSFDDSVRGPLPTVAEPALFAPPIEARQDGDALTLIFDVSGYDKDKLRVRTNGRNIFIWGPPLQTTADDAEARRAMRVFALPFDVTRRHLQTSYVGDWLRIRIAMPRARASAASTSHAA